VTIDGEEWALSSGAIGGVPFGTASLSVESEDDDGIHGAFDGTMVPQGENPSFDTLFVSIAF